MDYWTLVLVVVVKHVNSGILHTHHNSGKELDIGFGNLKLANGQYDMDRIHLLRYVSSIEPNFGSFVSNERRNIAQTMATTAPHIHIYFSQ